MSHLCSMFGSCFSLFCHVPVLLEFILYTCVLLIGTH